MTINKDDALSISILCLLAHLKQCRQQNFFMDDSCLVEAIQKNEPDTVSKMTNSIFKDALGHISLFNPSMGKYLQSDGMRYLCHSSFSQFVSVVNKDSQDYLYDDHGILNNKMDLDLMKRL